VAGGSVVAASSASAASKPTVARLAGADRYATAVAIAKQGFPHGAHVVFLASGANFPDALAAGPAAAKLGGPLLLTNPTGLPAKVATELKSLAPTHIYIVGGPSAVHSRVLTQVKHTVSRAAVTRLAGADRYATGRTVVANAFRTAPKAYVATGTGFADALSAAAAAGSKGDPVVLVNGAAGTVPASTLSTLKRLKATSLVIVGGASAVSSGILSQLRSHFAHVAREGGADRYATSAKIAKSQFGTASRAYFASGATFPDALAASVVAGRSHEPLLTVQPTCVPAVTASTVSSMGIKHVTLVGGTSALSTNVGKFVTCATATTHTIQNTSASYAIQSNVTLTGSGQGFHAKIELVTASAAVTFGIQYDAQAAAPYTGKPAFLLENVVNASGESGNRYSHTGVAAVGKSFPLLLTLQSNGTGAVYVSGREVSTFTNKSLAGHTVYARVQAVGKQNGDKASATFSNTLVRERGSVAERATSAVYPSHFTTNTSAGKTTNPIKISGTVSGMSGNWSTNNPEGVTVQFK
jgi:putative cell wall-binding protein